MLFPGRILVPAVMGRRLTVAVEDLSAGQGTVTVLTHTTQPPRSTGQPRIATACQLWTHGVALRGQIPRTNRGPTIKKA
jgi:hypothetical protein